MRGGNPQPKSLECRALRYCFDALRFDGLGAQRAGFRHGNLPDVGGGRHGSLVKLIRDLQLRLIAGARLPGMPQISSDDACVWNTARVCMALCP